MTKINYGEVKAQKNIVPSQAIEIANKKTIDILIIQAKASAKTKSILDEAGITLYEGVEPSEVERLKEIIAQEIQAKEKKETD